MDQLKAGLDVDVSKLARLQLPLQPQQRLAPLRPLPQPGMQLQQQAAPTQEVGVLIDVGEECVPEAAGEAELQVCGYGIPKHASHHGGMTSLSLSLLMWAWSDGLKRSRFRHLTVSLHPSSCYLQSELDLLLAADDPTVLMKKKTRPQHSTALAPPLDLMNSWSFGFSFSLVLRFSRLHIHVYRW